MFAGLNYASTYVRPPILIVGHERSGTHFLLNSLATCYGYLFRWYELDHSTCNINFYDPQQITKAVQLVTQHGSDHIVKSRHPVDFMRSELSLIASQFQIFYVYRDPVAVMLSYWRLIQRLEWMEGPLSPDPMTFMRSEPQGRMLRFQTCQQANLLQRWAHHVNGWLDAAQEYPRIIPVKFETLDQRFHETIQGFSHILGQVPITIVRPPRDMNRHEHEPADLIQRENEAQYPGLRNACRDEIGSTMIRLGY